MGLVLLLPGPDDLGAGEVSTALRHLGHEVRVLRASDLERARWTHRVDGSGVATRLVPAGGAEISDADVGAVLNRLASPSVRRFARSGPKDRDYAIAEWQALLVSWLQGLGDRVVGGVDGQGSRAQHAALSWWQWAHWCGLSVPGVIGVPGSSVDQPAPRVHREDLVRFVVVGACVLVQSGGHWRPSQGQLSRQVRALAVAGEADLLGVDVCVRGAGATLVGIDPSPRLRGAVALAVAELLDARAREHLRLAS